MLGSSIAPIALVFAVLDVSDAATAVGVVLAARSIPNVVFLLIGGVISDRLPRKVVLIVANTVSGLTQALAAVLVLSGHAQIWQLVVIEAVNGIASAFVLPAMMGILPSILDRSELPQANAVSGFARSIALIGGGAVAERDRRLHQSRGRVGGRRSDVLSGRVPAVLAQGAADRAVDHVDAA